MPSSAVQGHFAAEFATFLVATAGLAMVALRPELLTRTRWARVVSVAGFGVLATAAFLQGSLVVTDPTASATVLLHSAGLVALAVAVLRWSGGEGSGRLVLGGVVAMAAAQLLAASGVVVAADVALGAGATSLGVGLLNASRRSVAARFAASASAVLLAVVLVLSVALSAVLASQFTQDQAKRLDSRALTETNLIQTAGSTNTLLIARSASLLLSVWPAASNELQRLSAAGDAAASPALSGYLGVLRPALSRPVSLIYVASSGRILGTSLSGGYDEATVARLVASSSVQRVIASQPLGQHDERGTVEVIGGSPTSAAALGVSPVAVVDPRRQLTYPGVLLAVQPLDRAYLVQRVAVPQPVDANVSLALVTRSEVLAQAGPSLLDRPNLVRLAAVGLGTSDVPAARTIGDHFYAATVVRAGDGRPVMALVTAVPTTDVTNLRGRLFGTLFVIALGGTMLALLLAAMVGERVGLGLRTLTAAAQRVQHGDFSEASGVRTDDEVGVLGEAFDSMTSAISEHSAALQHAADEEAALRSQVEAVVAGMGEGLVAIDGEGRVTLMNRAAEELLEVSRQSAVGRPVTEVITAPADDGSDLAARLLEPSTVRWSVNVTLESDKGPGIPVAITSGVLRGPGGVGAGAVFVLRDLHPERQVERMKSELLSRVGHELRTPLTAILGYADILMHRKVPEASARRFYDEIYESGRRLSRVIEMLEFSAAAEAGRSLMHPESVSVDSLVDEVVSEWAARVDGRHAVVPRVQPGLPEILGDRKWLLLSLNELVDNAVKFSPEGGPVQVVASGNVTVGGAAAIEISVVDEGVGMSAEDRDRAFADFNQADASDTRRFGGLGLGLSLVKRVTEAHGGTVACTSVTQKGSTFSIILPV